MKKQVLAPNPLFLQIQTFIKEQILWIVGVFFIFLMWWYIQEDNSKKVSTSSDTNPLVPAKKSFSGQEEIEKESIEKSEEEDPELTKERKEIRAAQAKSTFQVYSKNFGTEQELIENLLARYNITVETIRDFPESALLELKEEELELLSKYQNREVMLKWARQQIDLYENIFKTRFKEIRKYRKEFVKRAKPHPIEIECALLEKLSDPFLSEPFYKEILVLLGLVSLNDTLNTFFFLFENEKTPSKQFCLFEAMVRLDSKKAITFLFKTLEGSSEIDIESVKKSIYETMTPGMEIFLAPFLDSKTPKISQIVREVLLRMNSPEAIEFLSTHEKENLKKQDTKSLKTELLKKLQKGNLGQLEHQEATFTICLLMSPESFEEVEALFLKETEVEKRVNWFSPMLTLNKQKAVPILVRFLDSKNELERFSSREIVTKTIGPGLESCLEPLLEKSSEASDLPEFARSILMKIDSPLAKKMLKSIKNPK